MPKIKFSEELKLKAVLDYLEKHMTQREVAQKYYASLGDVQKWVHAYEEHGADGLMIRQYNHKKYDGEFKIKVVEYMHEHNYSARQTAAHFNIPSYNSVCDWERKYLKGGCSALIAEPRGRKLGMKPKKVTKKEIDKEEKEDLIEEVKRLRMENEYLKKLNALIQKREKSEKSTK